MIRCVCDWPGCTSSWRDATGSTSVQKRAIGIEDGLVVIQLDLCEIHTSWAIRLFEAAKILSQQVAE